MNNTCDLKKELCRKKAEAEKAEKAYSKYLANESFKNITLNNDELCKMIASMPRDEVVIVLDEILNSVNFANVFKNAIITSEKLNNLRKSKAAKAERRKAKKVQEILSEQPDNSNETEPFGDAFSSESTETENVAPQSEQAELSEQDTQSDSFVHTSAETLTDFSQKCEQTMLSDQTDPPDYPGSSY